VLGCHGLAFVGLGAINTFVVWRERLGEILIQWEGCVGRGCRCTFEEVEEEEVEEEEEEAEGEWRYFPSLK
jgi:hypothetical protein